MTLGLTIGTDPNALRSLDMDRFGIVQVLLEKEGTQRLVLSEAILFDIDQDELKPSAEHALTAIFELSLAPAPGAWVRVEGHTDDSGTFAHNLDLSRRRADRVRNWLLARGRRETMVASVALGEARPRAPNDSDANRRANRRVELVLSTSENPAAAKQAAVTSSAQPKLTELLRSYYSDLNAGTFDANRYFEPSVERFITMKQTSTIAMNQYIRTTFPKQFKEHHFEMEEGTLTAEGPGKYIFIEHSRYVLARKQSAVEQRYWVRVRVSPNGKLVFFHQYQKAT